MERYNPEQAPEPQTWLELDEQERIDLIREYHDENDDGTLSEDDARSMHNVLHGLVETQLAENVEPVPATLAKLQRQGLKRHEAVHAVGAVLIEGLYKVMQGQETEFHPRQYRRRLDKLTAKRWRKGQY